MKKMRFSFRRYKCQQLFINLFRNLLTTPTEADVGERYPAPLLVEMQANVATKEIGMESAKTTGTQSTI